MDNKILAHWYKSNINNAGDTLTPFIVEYFTGKKVELAERNYHGKLLGVGSIMKALRPNDVVWGAGVMRKTDSFPHANKCKFLAVRGKLTAEILKQNGAEVQEVFGDPALLLPLMYKPKIEKRYKFGLLPHYIEQDQPVFKRLLSQDDTLVIDITQPWQKVIDNICSCDLIVSSSLHGIIIAEAYGIPAHWLKVSDKVLGDGFKFEDYLTGTGRTLPEPFYPLNGITDFKVLYTFPKIDKELLANIQQKLINSLKSFYS